MDVKSKIITQFIRDLSFENPNGPGSFQPGGDRPAINANIDVKAQNRKDTEVYEVELQINVGARRGEDSLYLVDIKYVGLFEIENLTDDKTQNFGRSDYMTSVIFNGNKEHIGKIVPVKIKEFNRTTLFGELVRDLSEKVA